MKLGTATIALVALMATVAWYSIHTRRANGDVLAYTCEIMRVERNPQTEPEFQDFHRDLYAEVHRYCTEAQWRDLTESSLRRRRGSSPQTGPPLLQQRWHKRKVAPRLAYRYTCYVLWKLGVPLGLVCYVVSGICAGLCLWPVYVIVDGKWPGVALAAICALGWRLDLIGCTASPDSMAAMAALLVLAYYRRPWCAVLIPATVLIRPDMVIFAGIAVWVLAIPGWWKLATVAVTMTLYVTVAGLYHCPPWSEWFYRDVVTPFFGLTAIPFDQSTPGVRFETYAAIMLHRYPLLYRGLFPHMFWVIAALACFRVTRQSWPLLVLPVAYYLIHFAAFPFAFHRFFAWCYVAVTLCLTRPPFRVPEKE